MDRRIVYLFDLSVFAAFGAGCIVTILFTMFVTNGDYVKAGGIGFILAMIGKLISFILYRKALSEEQNEQNEKVEA